jgi:hypothetical protein
VDAAFDCLLSRLPEDGSKKILIASVGSWSRRAFRGKRERVMSWALENGWDIDHLLALHDDIVRTPNQLDTMMRLMACSGAYEPLLISHPTGMALDIAAVPGFGVLVHNENRGYFLKETGSSHDDLFFAQVRALHRSATPLLRRYRHRSPEEEVVRDFRVTRVESAPGDYFVITNRLSVVAKPLEVYEREMLIHPRPPSWLENRRARLQAFEHDVQFHQYREIYSATSLDRFVDEGLFVGSAPGDKPSTVEDRVLVVKRMLDLLTSRPKYDVRLEMTSSDLEATRNAWEFKRTNQGAVVFLFAAKGTETKDSMSIEINDRALTDHFRKKFELQWELLEAAGASRTATETWLRARLARLDDLVARERRNAIKTERASA